MLFSVAAFPKFQCLPISENSFSVFSISTCNPRLSNGEGSIVITGHFIRQLRFHNGFFKRPLRIIDMVLLDRQPGKADIYSCQATVIIALLINSSSFRPHLHRSLLLSSSSVVASEVVQRVGVVRNMLSISFKNTK